MDDKEIVVGVVSGSVVVGLMTLMNEMEGETSLMIAASFK